MKKSRMITTMLVGVMILCLLAACGRSSSSDPSKSTGPERTEPNYYILGAGNTGGSSYAYNVALAEVVNAHSDKVKINPIASAGGTENLKFIESGEMHLGAVSASTYISALDNKPPFEEGDFSKISIMLPMYGNYITIVTRPDSGINCIADLEGKNFDLCLPTTSGNPLVRRIFTALGYDIDKFCNISESVYADCPPALQEGRIDAWVHNVSYGNATVQECAVSRTGMKLVPFSEEEIAKVNKAIPTLWGGVITADAYEGLDVDTPTLSSFITVFAHNSVPEDDIYEIVKILYENHDEFVAHTQLAKETTPEFMVEATDSGKRFPLHPGAVKYLKEKGLM